MFNLARTSYFLAVAVCTTIAVFNTVQLLTSLLHWNRWFNYDHAHVYTAAVIAAFLFPCSRAIVRMIRRAPLLPRPHESNTRAYLILITLTGIFAHIVAALTATAYVDIWVHHLSDVSGIGAAIIVAAFLYLVTLWVGELVVATSGGRAEGRPNPFPP